MQSSTLPEDFSPLRRQTKASHGWRFPGLPIAHEGGTFCQMTAVLDVPEIDRMKALIYAEAGVKEYWIVCPEKKQVEVYRQPSAQGYAEPAVFAAPAVLECEALPGVRVDFGALFA